MSWREIQRENFTSGKRLLRFLKLEGELPTFPSFPLNLPKRLAEKMEKGNCNDPLLLQFLPSAQEEIDLPGFSDDPVGDRAHQKTPRLLQKYGSRALLIATSACAMNCRFCFRQNYPYLKEPSFEEELEELRQDSSLVEVILSGGDPLSLSDATLHKLVRALETIPHLKLLRFHTRFPIGIPERITKSFVKIIEESSLQTIFVLHTNHPKELDETLFTRLRKIPAPILTQTVLLKGVNDDFDTLKTLFLELACHGIIPYYLHQLDRVKQASHFEVSIERGLQLMEALRCALPGYALPRYVQEVEGEKSKIAL